MQSIGRAALVTLAVTGMAAVGSGVAFAHGHEHHHQHRYDGFGRGHGATARGGFSGARLFQQNTAQAYNQNTNCSHRNEGAPSSLLGGHAEFRCVNGNASFNKHTLVKDGGAHANGGSSTASELDQQNTAQKGRQNNNCDDANGSQIHLTGSRTRGRCVNLDRSRNERTLVKGGRAEAEGGSAMGGIDQQNTAQDGRQNNNCGNDNRLILTATGSTTHTECTAFDRSKNIHTINR